MSAWTRLRAMFTADSANTDRGESGNVLVQETREQFFDRAREDFADAIRVKLVTQMLRGRLRGTHGLLASSLRCWWSWTW